MQPDSLKTGPGFTCFVDIKQNVKLHLQIATIVHIGHILGYKNYTVLILFRFYLSVFLNRNIIVLISF